MAKFQEAQVRLYKNIFVCRKCKRKRKANPLKVLQGMVKCRNCGCKALRAARKSKGKTK